MNDSQIEKALKICSSGAKEKMTKCHVCPYEKKGCLSALLADTSRYIDRLKVPRHGDMPRSSERGSQAPNPPKRGKPVSEWLDEERKERARTGAKDCGDIPW